MCIDTFQNFYGLAIKRNKGNPQVMSAATMATLNHNKEKRSHEDCPQGKDSWCSFNMNKAAGENTYQPIKYPFPNVVAELLNPSLSDWEALVLCRLLQIVAHKMLMNRSIISSDSQLQRKFTHPQAKPNVHSS